LGPQESTATDAVMGLFVSNSEAVPHLNVARRHASLVMVAFQGRSAGQKRQEHVALCCDKRD
jgi:hypothetical protein